MRLDKIKFLIFLVFGLCLPITAQTVSPEEVENYEGEDLSFAYPANWKITDKSKDSIQQMNLTPEGANALIVVVAYRPIISTREEFNRVKGIITQNYLEKISQGFTSAERTQVCTKIADSRVPGYRFTGSYGSKESTGDIFSFALDDKFISLIYMRENKDGSKADAAWEMIGKTLRVKDRATNEPPKLSFDSVVGSILNGHAIKLPKPIFPSVKVSGNVIVEVEVVIDEKGDVISVKPLPSDPRFQPAALQAAKKAKFHPTSLCGEPIKVRGVIVYNFNPR